MIQELKNEKSVADNEMIAMRQQLDAMTEKQKSIQMEVSESKREAEEILEQSKLRIDKMKKQFKAHRLDLIKRMLEFVYIKYDEVIKDKDDDDEFNYISFFRAMTKKILANPDDFDEEEEDDSVSSDNA